MEFKSKPITDGVEWHKWFAWHPVRVPRQRNQPGSWVWLEVVERRIFAGFDYFIEYRKVS